MRLSKERIENIPVEMRYEDKWVNWNPKKVPIDPKTGKFAKCSDPETWGTFNQALIKTTEHGAELGIGFCLGEEYCSLDFDHVINPETGEWHSPEAKEVFDQLDGCGYVEKSPSGDGLHVIFWCTKPTGVVSKKRLGSVPWTDKESAIEFFGANGEDSKHRYMTVTGDNEGYEGYKITKVADGVVAKIGAKYFQKAKAPAIDYVEVQRRLDGRGISSTLDRYVEKIIQETSQGEGGRNGKLFSIAGNVAAHAGYDFDRTLAAVQEINAKCMYPPVEQRELYRIVDNSINKGTRRVVNPLSSPAMESAIQLDHIDPLKWIPEVVEEEKKTHTFDFKKLRDSSGFIGKYMRYMLARGDMDMPQLQLAGALSIMSSTLTGKIEIHGKYGKLAPNMFIAAFAPSGFGKSNYIRTNQHIMKELNLGHRAGAEKMTSGAGFAQELGVCSVTSMYYDEIQELFKGEADSKLTGSKADMLKMAQTKSGDDFKPTCYADPSKNVVIEYCAPTISGWGVGEIWWENFPEWAKSDGTLGRMLILEDGNECLDSEKDIEGDASIPSSLVEWLRRWGHEGDYTLLEDKNIQPREIKVFTYEPEAEEMMHDWSKKIRRRGANHRTELTDAWNQSGRKVAKLACLFAADEFGADGDSVVQTRHVALAISLVKATMYKVEERVSNVTSDDTVKLAYEIERRLISERRGMTMKKIHSFWKRRLFSDIEKAVQHLIKTDTVDAETFKGRGDVPKIVHVEHVGSLIEEESRDS